VGDTPNRPLIDDLRSVGSVHSINAGDVLCTEGDESRQAFVVDSGQLEASVGGAHGPVVLGRYGPGALVGEITALVGGRRTATLRATETTVICVIDSGALQDVFARHPNAAADVMVEARDRTDRSRVATLLARELDTDDDDVIAAIATRVSWLRIPAGEVLFEQGDDADSAYLVLSGRMSVEDDTGTQRFQVGRGGIIGEFGLLDDRPRSATVRALRDAGLARLTSADFAELASHHTQLAMGLVRRIVDRSGSETTGGPGLGRSACVIVTAPVDARLVTTKMVNALLEIDSTAHLSAARVDAMLGQMGAAATQPGEIGDVRLIELLHQADADHSHVLLEGHLDHPAWTKRALRHADQIVVVCSSDPTPEEAAHIEAVLRDVPEDTPSWLALNHPAGTDRPHGSAEFRDRFGVDEIHHVHAASTDDLARVARLAVGEGVALVLSGGGARGFAHLGVIAAMEEHGVPIDRIAGASMGSVIAAAIAQRIDASQRVEITQAAFKDLLDYTIPVVSLVKGERITANIQHQWGGFDIEDLWLPFSCVTTNLTTSQVVQHRTGPTDLAVRASVAIPGVLPPVPFDGDLLIDGGVLDNLPVDLVANDPSIGTIIAVDVTPPLGPRAKGDYGLSVSGWSALRNQMSRKKNQYPGVVAVLMRTMLIGSARDRARTVESGDVDFYLDLELKGVSLLDFETVEDVTARGYEAAVDRVGAWWSEYRSAPREDSEHASAHAS
jgi:predicted acylesterase/phospholipase RssA/CRP-like cAMP-binding protein